MDDIKKEMLKKEVSRLFKEYGRENVDQFVFYITDYLSNETGYTFDYW